MYNRFLSIQDFSNQWTTPATDLDNFVSKRGDIAHKGRQAKYIKIGELKSDREIINSLVAEVD